MKKRLVNVFSRLLLAGFVLFFAQSCQKQEAVQEKTFSWIEDFDQAKAAAKESGKPIFVLFTGSDWCPWCVKLESEVLAKPEFEAYAKENLVLFKADYLRGKPMPANLKPKNDALKEKLAVQGFPTVILMDKEEKVLGRTGYKQGGPQAYVEHLKQILNGK